MPRPELEHYKAELKRAREDLTSALLEQEDLHERLDELNEEISALRRIVSGLADYCGEKPEMLIGLTEACAEYMRGIELAVTTNDVVTAIGDMGVDLGSQKNASASIHAILTRLAKRGEIKKIESPSGVTWQGPKYDPDAIPF